MPSNIIKQVKVNVGYAFTTLNSAQEHASKITSLTFTQALIIKINVVTVA